MYFVNENPTSTGVVGWNVESGRSVSLPAKAEMLWEPPGAHNHIQGDPKSPFSDRLQSNFRKYAGFNIFYFLFFFIVKGERERNQN